MRPAPVVLVAAGFGAGLATGLARFQVPLLLLAGLGFAWHFRSAERSLPAMALLVGLTQGVLTHRLQPDRCVNNPLAVIGALTPCPRPPPQQASHPDSIRGWLQATSERLYGSRAPMVDALVLGLRTRMDPALRDAFARSGLVHLLSISGFHVGLIVAWLVLLARLARVPRGWAASLAAGVGVAYVGFLGWPAPASRAAAMACLGAFCLMRQRRVQPTPLLVMTCLLVVLFDPWAIFDLGGWLSASALWGATAFTRWGAGALGRHVAWRTFCASVGATVATAPVTAAAFGSIALAGVLLNFAAIPLAAIAVPGIAASLLAAVAFPPAAEPFAAGAGLALAGLERLALAGSQLPGGMLTVPTGWPGALAGGAVLLAASWIAADRTPGREALRRLALGFSIGWLPLAILEWQARTDGEGQLSLFFLAVGQG
ncbi:MAG TPA: ComEC/Rec2 family competence protein, partial [Gemmatimonadales bacterium]